MRLRRRPIRSADPTVDVSPILTSDPLREALCLIDRYGCEKVTGGRRCWDVGLVRGAEYGADAWCDPCIARAALEGAP